MKKKSLSLPVPTCTSKQLRHVLEELLTFSESIFVRHPDDPENNLEAVHDLLGRANTMLNRSPGCGPRKLWLTYAAAKARAVVATPTYKRKGGAS